MVARAKYRKSLPQLEGGLFLTDGGIETTLIFHDGLDLPYFAAFDLLREPRGARRWRAITSATSPSRAERRRLHPGEPDLAGKRRLGRQARLFGR